jgi:uncharacterized protein YbjQ (UPF0145 family)
MANSLYIGSFAYYFFIKITLLKGPTLRNIVGGRSGAYEKELRKAGDIAFEEIVQAAHELGATAVVGVDIDYEVLSEKNGMLMVSISGMAVIVE